MSVWMLLLLLLGVALGIPSHADDAPTASARSAAPKEPTWWEKRDKRTDIYFPHNAHMEILKQEGDACMLCHGFGPNQITDEKKLKPLTTIANEPLKAICHDCHVTEQRGPWRCDLCHDDKTRIWPNDHKFGYVEHHGETARRDEEGCRECHLDLAFCTNCHFRRDTMGTGYHPLGYRSLHGLDARIESSNCGRCHNGPYCDDCHRANR